MKKILFLLAALFLTVSVFAQYEQTVFLDYKKKEVKKLMMVHYPQCKLIVEAKDYLEYRKDDIHIGYHLISIALK